MAGTSGINRLIGGSQKFQEIVYDLSKNNFQKARDAVNEARNKTQSSSFSKDESVHQAMLAEKFKSYQAENKFCDITIIIGGKSFRAHKLVLAVSSEYFETMFSGSFVESSKSEVEIDGDSKAFEKLLQFAYTSKLELDDDGVNVLELLKLASYMQFTKVVDKCSKVLLKDLDDSKLSVEDAFEITALTKSHGKPIDKLYPSAVWCLALEFKEFIKTDAFLDNLCVEVFEDVLKKPDVACTMTEPELLESIIKWLSHDLAKRRPHGLQLVKRLRLDTIPRQDIDNALEFFQKNDMKECSDNFPSKRKTDDGDLADAGQGTPRNIITAPLVTGGSEDNTVMYFDREHMCWAVPPCSFAPAPALHSGKITDHSCIVVNGVLYLAGGNDELLEEEFDGDTSVDDMYEEEHISKKLKKFYKYDPESNSWTALASMRMARSHFAMVQLGSDIYAIGGLGVPDFWGTKALDAVECYSIAENKWRSIPSMSSFVAKPKAVVHGGKILVYGNGVTWMEQRTTDYVLQMYDPENRKWFKLCQETYWQPRHREGTLIVHDGKCYRICFVQRNEDDQIYGRARVGRVTINEWRLRDGQERLYAVIGRDQRQAELKCKNGICVGDEVFVYFNEGFLYDTGIKVSEIGTDGLGEEWDEVCMGIREDITTFTFDILKLKPKK